MASSGAPKAASRKPVQESAQAASLVAHVLDAEQHLLAVAPHAERHQQRQPGRALVEANPHHRPVEDEAHDIVHHARMIAPLPRLPVGLDLVPGPADRSLADRAAEQRGQRLARRVLVPARYVAAISASARRVSRL